MGARLSWLLYGLAALMLLPGAVSSCSSIDCPVENIVAIQYEIRDKDNDALAISDSLSVVTARLDGTYVDITALLNSDDVTLNKLVGKSAFSLPVSYSHPEDILFFCFTDTARTVVDTVWIKKDDIPHFESVDCNASFFHRLTGVRYTTNAIDSLVIKNTNVDYDRKTVHLLLYPKVSD